MATREFFGRRAELAMLNRELDQVRAGGSRPGRCLIIRGRRRVGKSRLVEEFRENAGVPSLFFTASKLSATQELENLRTAITDSDIPGRDEYGDGADTWDASLRLLAGLLPDDVPSVVVLDELPYLTSSVNGFEGTLQTVWDRILSRKPVLLLLIGSDLSIMQSINAYDRPFHQRGVPMVINPLNPREVGELTGTAPAEAFDAYLITGGLPILCGEWSHGAGPMKHLEAVVNPRSAFVTTAQLTLDGEFPPSAHANVILPAIATGERAFNQVLGETGMNRMTFARGLEILIEKGAVTAERPLSMKSSRDTRYRITDPYLRFWLRFVQPQLGQIDRGLHDTVLRRISSGWRAWRGRAVEPIVREALARMLPKQNPDWLDADAAGEIGGYWTRTNDVEVDLVMADRGPVAKRIGLVGSVKWHDGDPFDQRDLADLIAARPLVPGATKDTPLIAVSRVPSDVPVVDAVFNAKDLVSGWE